MTMGKASLDGTVAVITDASTVARESSASAGKPAGFTVDVAKRTDAEVFVKGAAESFGRIDVIVNGTGIMPIAPIEVASALAYAVSRRAEEETDEVIPRPLARGFRSSNADR